MSTRNMILASVGFALVAVQPAAATDRVGIGLVYTLTGGTAVLGAQARDAFMLAVKDLGGKIGGLPVDITVIDDEGKPDVALTRVKGMLDRGNIQFVVGPINANILGAIFKPITESQAFLVSSNSNTSAYAGAQCSANFFLTGYQTDQPQAALGKAANERNLKKVFILAPNYQAGRDAVHGFKTTYKGTIVGESFVPLNTLDFQSELASIAAAGSDAVYTFMPGGMGVNLVRQFRQSGLADKVTFLSSFTVDEANLPAQKEAALGLLGASNWAPDLDLPQSKKFVAEFEAAYGSIPATYGFQAYDAALLIDSAVRATKGDLSNKDAVRVALEKADFQSLRGNFKFNTNHYPIQDFYLYKVIQRPDGKFQTSILEKVLSNDADAYAKDCPLKK